MLETKETIQFKNVDYNHNAIIKYLKTSGELHEYSDLIKVCPERNKIIYGKMVIQIEYM